MFQFFIDFTPLFHIFLPLCCTTVFSQLFVEHLAVVDPHVGHWPHRLGIGPTGWALAPQVGCFSSCLWKAHVANVVCVFITQGIMLITHPTQSRKHLSLNFQEILK